MKMLLTVVLSFSFAGCMTFDSKEAYILKLAEKCEDINISTHQTILKCPNYRSVNNGNNRVSTATKIKGK